MCKSLPAAGFGGGRAMPRAALAQDVVGLEKMLLI